MHTAWHVREKKSAIGNEEELENLYPHLDKTAAREVMQRLIFLSNLLAFLFFLELNWISISLERYNKDNYSYPTKCQAPPAGHCGRRDVQGQQQIANVCPKVKLRHLYGKPPLRFIDSEPTQIKIYLRTASDP